MIDAASIIFIILLVATFGAALWLEFTHGARSPNVDNNRLLLNFGLGVANMTLAAVLRAVPVVAAFINGRVWQSPLAADRLPLPVEAAAALLLFSLIGYWLHRAMHAVPLLWRLHRLHHSDAGVDFSTGFRSHPLAYLLSSALTAATIIVVGFSEWAVALALGFTHAVDLFTHANGTLPPRAERWLGLLLVTPSVHLRHHSTDRLEHDSNFCTSLIFWDRLFGTYSGKASPRAVGL